MSDPSASVDVAKINRVHDYAQRNGYTVRKARKAGQCEFWMGKSAGGRCKHVIQPGEFYVAGELDPYKAGGFHQERWCSEHFE